MRDHQEPPGSCLRVVLDMILECLFGCRHDPGGAGNGHDPGGASSVLDMVLEAPEMDMILEVPQAS